MSEQQASVTSSVTERVVVVGPSKDFSSLSAAQSYFGNQNLPANGECIGVRMEQNDSISQDKYFFVGAADDTHFVRIFGANRNITLTFNTGTPWHHFPGIVFDNLTIKIVGDDPSAGPATDMRGNNAGRWPGYQNCHFIIDCAAAVAMRLGESYLPGFFMHGNTVEFTEKAVNTYFYEMYGGPPADIQQLTFLTRVSRSKAPIHDFAAGTIQDSVFSGFTGSMIDTVYGGNFVNNYTDSQAETRNGFSKVSVGALLSASPNDFTPKNPGPLIGTGSDIYRYTYDRNGVYRGDLPDVGPVQAVAQVVTLPVEGEITSIETRGQKRILKGTLTQAALSATFQLTPADTTSGATATTGTVEVDNDAKTFVATVTATPGNYVAERLVFSNVAGDTALNGPAPFTIAMPDLPTITVTKQTQTGTRVDVVGTYTGYPVSGQFTLTAAAAAAGAVTKGPVVITFADNGTWSATVTSVNYGNYANSPATATNAAGTATAYGGAFSSYAPGNAPPGLPAVSLPDYVITPFNSPTVAFDEVITTLVFENTTSSPTVDQPFCIGHPFKQGQLKVRDNIEYVIGGSSFPAQFDVRSTWPDGSVRHAVISGMTGATTSAGEKKTVSLVRVLTNGATTPSYTVNTITDTGINAKVTATLGGVTYTADADDALLNSGTAKLWLSGIHCVEYGVVAKFKAPDGAPHPLLEARFEIRYFPAKGMGKVDVTVECNDAYSPMQDITYDTSISIGGNVVFSQSALEHFYAARWKKTFYYGYTPSIHVRFDTNYLLDTKMVPNWDRNLVIPESVLAGMATELATTLDMRPMRNGKFSPDQSGTGGRPEIGLAPRWTVQWLLSQDARAKEYSLRHSDLGGSWSIHYRNRTAGPAAGYPVDPVHFPYVSRLGNYSDCNNPATGQNEHLPDGTTNTWLKEDISHHPAFGNIPYLLTGDIYYLEEIMFWAAYCVSAQHPGYRKYERSVITPEQIRGQAWTIRDLADAAALLPDFHPLKSTYVYMLNSNMDYYKEIYVDNPNANKLGATDVASDSVYDVGGGYGNGRPTWQDDFHTSAIGHAYDLGFDKVKPFLMWKAQYPIGRMIAPGYCWVYGAIYALALRPNRNEPYFNTFAEAYNFSVKEVIRNAGTCGSQEMADAMFANEEFHPGTYHGQAGEMFCLSDSTEGYPSNMQPGLAAAVDSGYPGGKSAWELFESRSIKPDYASAGPQFDVLPRTLDSDGTVDPVVTDVTITPNSATVDGGGSIQLAAAVWGVGDYSNAVTWSIQNGGSITQTGFVTLPAATNFVQTVTATATSNADTNKKGNCVITIPALVVTQPDPDTTAPVMTGNLSVSSVTQTSATLSWNSGTDNVGIAGYEYSKNGGASYTSAGNVLTVVLSGLTSSTTYTVGVRAYDVAGNKSNVLSAQLTTLSTADTTAPVMVGSISVGAISQTTMALSWQAATDNVAVEGYEYSVDGGTVYTSVGTSLGVTVTNLTPDTSYSVRVRGYDAAGNRTTPLSVSARTSAIASNFTPSIARTVAVQPSAPNFIPGKFWTLVNGSPHGPKDPDSTIDITFDWAAWLADMGGSSIAKVKFTLQGVQDGGSYATGSKTTVFVSGGTVGTAAVSCRITTDSIPPRIDERTVYLDLGEQ